MKNRLKTASVIFFALAFIGFLITLYYFREADKKESRGFGLSGLDEEIRAFLFLAISSVSVLTGGILWIISRKKASDKPHPKD